MAASTLSDFNQYIDVFRETPKSPRVHRKAPEFCGQALTTLHTASYDFGLLRSPACTLQQIQQEERKAKGDIPVFKLTKYFSLSLVLLCKNCKLFPGDRSTAHREIPSADDKLAVGLSIRLYVNQYFSFNYTLLAAQWRRKEPLEL
jgi:hypothetical protein